MKVLVPAPLLLAAEEAIEAMSEPDELISDAYVDFGRIAPRYDELRNIGERWPELVDLLVREGDLRGRRVLDVGSGTGRLATILVERYGVQGVGR